jgi:hypothetical protein
MSCHGMDGHQKNLFDDVPRSLFESDLDFAEFLFMTRHFFKASHYYDLYLNKPIHEQKNHDRDLAINRKIFILITILKDDELLSLMLKEQLKIPNLTDYQKEQLQDWMEGLKKTSSLNLHSLNTWQDLSTIMKTYFDESPKKISLNGGDDILHLKLYTYLHRFLNLHPDHQQAPQILYWISLIEKKLPGGIFFNLADLYLKECFLSYPQHPTGKLCLQEYENNLIFSFTGSSGTQIPEEIQKELNRYKKLYQQSNTLSPSPSKKLKKIDDGKKVK